MRTYRLLALSAVVLTLLGCGPANRVPAEVLADPAGWPADVDRHGDGWAYLVRDEASLARLWEAAGLDSPEVDFDRDGVLALGVGESSSCPLELASLARGEGGEHLVLHWSGSWRTCRSDFILTTFFIRVDVESVPDAPFPLVLSDAPRPLEVRELDWDDT